MSCNINCCFLYIYHLVVEKPYNIYLVCYDKAKNYLLTGNIQLLFSLPIAGKDCSSSTSYRLYSINVWSVQKQLKNDQCLFCMVSWTWWSVGNTQKWFQKKSQYHRPVDNPHCLSNKAYNIPIFSDLDKGCDMLWKDELHYKFKL